MHRILAAPWLCVCAHVLPVPNQRTCSLLSCRSNTRRRLRGDTATGRARRLQPTRRRCSRRGGNFEGMAREAEKVIFRVWSSVCLAAVMVARTESGEGRWTSLGLVCTCHSVPSHFSSCSALACGRKGADISVSFITPRWRGSVKCPGSKVLKSTTPRRPYLANANVQRRLLQAYRRTSFAPVLRKHPCNVVDELYDASGRER